MATANQEFLIIKQKVEVLAGERGDPRQAAIRMIYLSQLQELISKLTKSTTSMQALVSALNADVVGVRGDVLIVQESVAHVQADVGGLQDDVIQVTSNVAIIQQSLSDANEDLETLQLEIGNLQTEVNGLAGVTAEVDQLQLDVGTLQTGQTNLTNTVNGIQSDVTAVPIPTMSQGAVSAPPTAAEFNNLVSDVAALRTALLSMKTAIM